MHTTDIQKLNRMALQALRIAGLTGGVSVVLMIAWPAYDQTYDLCMLSGAGLFSLLLSGVTLGMALVAFPLWFAVGHVSRKEQE